ncbi:hypothetical protein [Streptomyces phaeochromogenes]|uniref:hypothetical protein n=1 Tax=Streptomyces phaeochromogenes TaxID=1923 RepID=UPI002DD94979|nr:hypothetical protein [Streptomyces phaeochromogenes]WRZ28050.1 hypothetical protein OG931_09985 [Streptomyces phaeochromogenes]
MVSHTAPNEGGGNGETADRPSAVFERAVDAYAHGNFALAVSHLRLWERHAYAGQAVIDAGHAALRGAIAARAGNWAECCDWYIRSLAASGAVGTRSPESTEPCHNNGCSSPAGNRCGQCTRWFCPTHGAASKDEVSRCGPCLDVAVHNLAHAAIMADRVEAAVEALTPWAGTPNWTTVRALLACLAPEHAAGLGEQMETLDAVVPDRRKALVLYRASRTLADVDLERLSVPLPGAEDSSPPAVREWLRPWKARGLRRVGRHTEAWRVRYEDWLARPVDTTVVHALAVEAFRVFTDDAETDGRTRLDAVRQAMACWALVLHSASYWQELARRSERPWTRDDERKNASDTVAERIRQALRDDDRAAERPVVDSLELAWDVELAAARGLATAVATTDFEWPLHAGSDFSFGPGFLGLLRSAGAPWAALVEKIHGWVSAAGRTGDETGERLRNLMSPEGRHAMLLETGRFDQAIAAIEAEATVERPAQGDAEPWSGPQRFLGAALVARALDRVKSQRWSEALRDFEEAAAVGASLNLHEKEIGRAGAQAGRALLGNPVAPNWQAYVGPLQRALVLAPEDNELKRNLAAGCVHLGKQARQRRDWDKARARFSQAYELDPLETTAAALNEADTRWAESLLERRPSSELVRIITTLRKALDRDAKHQPARKALATALQERSLDVALTGARTEAMGLMREARDLLLSGSDDWIPGWGPKDDIANGLYERAVPVDVSNKDDLRNAFDVLAVARTYDAVPGIADEQAALLARLIRLLCGDENYDEAIRLVRRRPRDAKNQAELDRAFAEAYAGRARRRRDEGDIAAAHSDVRAVYKYDPAHPLVLFGLGETDQLW